MPHSSGSMSIQHCATEFGGIPHIWAFTDTDTKLASGWLTPEDIAYRRRKRLQNGGYEEFGLDGFVERADSSFLGIQCKHYADGGHVHKLGNYALALMAMQRGHPSNGGVMCMTPGAYASGYEMAALDQPKFHRYIRIIPFEDRPDAHAQKEQELELRPVQKRALDFLAGKKSCLLSMVCSTGKTVVAGHHLAMGAYDVVVLAAPLRVSAEQNLVRLAKFLPGHKGVRFWCGGDTLDPGHLRHQLEEAGPCLVCTTFKSADVVYDAMRQSLGEERRVIVVIDEAHNLSDEHSDGGIAKRLAFHGNAHWHTLLMTATPPAYLKEAFQEFSYGQEQAILDGNCCDYRIVLPLVTEKDRDVVTSHLDRPGT